MNLRALAAATAAIMVLGPVAGAHAHSQSPSDPVTLAEGLVGPLFLAVGPGKAVTVSESFTGNLKTVAKGTTTTIYSNPGWDVAGSAYKGSTLYFLESVGAGPDERPMVGALKSIDKAGNVRTITSKLAQYEINKNLDRKLRYGLSAADAAANPDCVAELTALGLPATYTGADVEVDSHVYGLAIKGNTAYVADAGANAVLSVDLRSGKIGTLAVLPAHPVLLTPETAEAQGVPSCAGLNYSFEAVPTDVEIGPDGKVYVATLPGGPEDPSLGNRGKVFRIDPNTGKAKVYASGLLSPTGIAFDSKGNLYVASLFGEGVYKIRKGSSEATLVLPAMMAADVDISGSTLYVTTEVFGNGKLVSYKL